MSTPPPPIGPSPSSYQSDDNHSSQQGPSGSPSKQFSLNQKKQQKQQDDTGAAQGQVEQKQEGVSGQKEAAKAEATEGISAAAQAAQMRAVSSTIIKMVDSIQHGDGITTMQLKSTDKVPVSFQGTQLTIDQTTSKISFQNFKTEQAALDAKDQILQSPEELQHLADQLYDRGFRNTSIELGQNITIQLPQASQALPSPAQVMHDQSSMEREGGGQQQKGGRDQGEPEGPQE